MQQKTAVDTWLWFKVLQVDLILVFSDVLMPAHHHDRKLKLWDRESKTLKVVTRDMTAIVDELQCVDVPFQILSPEFPAWSGSSSSPPEMIHPVVGGGAVNEDLG